ncbi:cell death protein Grim [Drosophila sulfurigaster albostrigata]|uniref:cell death protein Grim n=1 Tax=Drosophila sulfurigaster albostrigata TaxID=89887 RepID=UPI002D21D592|nr:cell death protein Grim [Drosophila sulfurigaster albostrigata]
MAIAYFIPDQAQLLARSRQQAAANTTSSSANNSPHNQQQQQRPQQQQQQHQQRGGNSQFRANISVPLGREQGAMTMSEFGCWELLAQIFCYALRLYSYNPAQRRPTVIQISFEISSGASNQDAEAETEVNAADGDVTDASSKQQ